MKVGDWVLVVTPSKSTLDMDIGCIDGPIIAITSKAIQVEWEVEASNKEIVFYRTWIPKSIISLLEADKTKRENKIIDSYTITLPEWVRLNVTTRFE
jgi:hypothetical protein